MTSHEVEEWRSICEASLLHLYVNEIEDVLLTQYNNDSQEFLKDYLHPYVALINSIRLTTEEHFTASSTKSPELFVKHFEAMATFAIHPRPVNINLHKGDFYIHITESSPRAMILVYYDAGKLCKQTLTEDDIILMCTEKWTDLIRAQSHNRFILSNCLIRNGSGYEKHSWKYILKMKIDQKLENDTSRKLKSDITTITSNVNDLRSSASSPLHILDIDFEILHSQVAYLHGGRDKRGGYVIVIDGSNSFWENPDMCTERLARLLMYYHSVPRDDVRVLGCSIIVDVRRAKKVMKMLRITGEAIAEFQEWGVPDLILNATETCGKPIISDSCSVRMVYLLARRDSLLLLYSAAKIAEHLPFKFQLISSFEKLHQQISREELPNDLEGSMWYDHERWIKFRTKLEPYMTGCRSAAKHAMASMQELSSQEVGNNASDCRQLLERHRQKTKEVLEDSRLQALRQEGKQILERLIEDDDDKILRTDDYTDTLDCVTKLYNQMDQVFAKLETLSRNRSDTLNLCLRVRLFEETYEKCNTWLVSEGEIFIANGGEAVGDSIGHVKSLQLEFDNFEINSKANFEAAHALILEGHDLLLIDSIQEDGDWIKEKLSKFERDYESFTSKFQDRRKRLKQSLEFHSLFQQASDWFVKGLHFVAQMNMDNLQTHEGCIRLKQEVVSFLKSTPPVPENQLAHITELAHHLGSKELKMQAEQVITRCKDVEEIIGRKKNAIISAASRLQNDEIETSTISDEQSSGYKDDDLSTEVGDESKDTDDSGLTLFSWNQDSTTYDERDELLVAFDAAISTKMKQRLHFIIKELIDTEHDYVRSLEYIMEHYMAEMDKPNIPPTLAGKKNVLFGNLTKIHDFHKLYFSQKLESCQFAPLQVGKCFLQWERQFYLYALYNKNKPKCDALLNDFGNTFFKEKQEELGDRLNLASYLIKPVQRLGKYALLLRDMINCCSPDDPRVPELTDAHDLMKFQLRHGNDLMAMDSIRGCDVNLKEQGCLLRQGDFFVWSGRRKRLRRVFLFEHSILLTKSKKQSAQGDIFMYKLALKNADVGLTENIGSSGLKFELWYRRWRRSRNTENFVLQASSTSVKEAWVADITRILWRQAQRNKEYGITEMATGISVESHPLSVLDETTPSTTIQPMLRQRNPSEMKSATGHRLSWISGSSNSSGVYDMGGTFFDADTSSPVFDEDAVVIHSSLQRKTSSGSVGTRRCSSIVSANEINEAMAEHRILRRETSFDGEFVRSNINRRTIHSDNRAHAGNAAREANNRNAQRAFTFRNHADSGRPKSASPRSSPIPSRSPSKRSSLQENCEVFDELSEDNQVVDITPTNPNSELLLRTPSPESPTIEASECSINRRRLSSSSSTNSDFQKDDRRSSKSKEPTRRSGSLASLLRLRKSTNEVTLPPNSETLNSSHN